MKLCKNCGEPLAEGKRSHAVFCDVTCKKQAEHKRRITNGEKREANRVRAKLWREQNKERAKAAVENWHKENPERASFHKAKYRYTRMDATPSWLTEGQLLDMANLHVLCRKLEDLTPAKYHVDHIIPLQGKNVCGLNVPWNLQVLEAGINMGKGNRLTKRKRDDNLRLRNRQSSGQGYEDTRSVLDT
jgi:hypothetical protein